MNINKILSELIIRKARISDIDKIENVMKLSMSELGKDHYNEEQLEASCKYICVLDKQMIEDNTYYVAEYNGEIIGCGGWSFRKNPDANSQNEADDEDILDPKNDRARIRGLFISPAASGMGVGSLILKTAEEAAKAGGFTRIALCAMQSGLEFYKTKGWNIKKHEMYAVEDGTEIEVTRMEKDF